jgi:hypothetical protein
MMLESRDFRAFPFIFSERSYASGSLRPLLEVQGLTEH